MGNKVNIFYSSSLFCSCSDEVYSALQHLRTLLHLLLTNSEARKLVTDSSIIGRDLLSMAASKAAGAIAPSDEQLRAVDQSAPNDHFVTNEKGENVLRADVPGTGHTLESHPTEGVRVHTEGGQTKDTNQLMAEGQDTLRRTQESGQAALQAHCDDVQQQVDAAPEDQKSDVAKTCLRSKILGFRVCVSSPLRSMEKLTMRL
jgi:hypothetical protein